MAIPESPERPGTMPKNYAQRHAQQQVAERRPGEDTHESLLGGFQHVAWASGVLGASRCRGCGRRQRDAVLTVYFRAAALRPSST